VIVLDTHALVWWVSDQRLSPDAAAAISAELEGGSILVSSITAWELALLVRRDKLELSTDLQLWLSTAEQVRGVRFVPIDNAIAVASIELPGTFHSDPADRIIVATARTLGADLITADQKIRAYPHVRTVW
jgi:PIN domain nuclease of toxin-antitoxin system